MASISSLGLGSGLDLNSILSNLRNAENLPLQAIQQRQTSYTAKLSAYGQLQSALSSLQSASSALMKPALFQGVNASSSASGVLSAKAASDADTGSFAVNVTKLAQAQSLAAAGVASTSTAIGNGRVTIEFGTISGVAPDVNGHYNSATFTPDATRTAQSITIDASNHTLTGIRSAINANSALGVTASIVNDGGASPYRLVLTSKTTGEKSSMHITVDDGLGGAGDPALTSLLAYDATAVTQTQQETSTAQDTKATVNGIAVSSATNSIKDAIAGVTMTLASTGSSTVTVAKDTASVTSAINAFVSAYNGLQNMAASLSAYNVENKSGAALSGDSTLRNIQVRLRSVLNTPQSSGTMTMLSQAGVSFTKNGTLQVDSTKLGKALDTDLDGVMKLFSGVSGSGGFGTQVSSLIDGFNGTNGLLKAAQTGVTSTLKELDKQFSDTQARINATMERYQTQFSRLDTLVSSMKQTGNYLTQQFAAMNGTNSK
jgi:flagellar hook-associated protein 2